MEVAMEVEKVAGWAAAEMVVATVEEGTVAAMEVEAMEVVVMAVAEMGGDPVVARAVGATVEG